MDYEVVVLTGAGMAVAALLLTLGRWTQARDRLYWLLMFPGIAVMFIGGVMGMSR